MKIFSIKTTELEELKRDIKANSPHYAGNATWLDAYFKDRKWYQESSLPFPEDLELLMPGTGAEQHNDLENTKRVYTALKHLPFSVAIDERFWAYLTHVTFWNYMRQRWPIENGEKTKNGATPYIREHYFFMGNRDRALIRNGISRLWWYGHVSYDETRENPFELTEVLLEKLDIAQQLLERSYSRNSTITKTILSHMLENKKKGQPFSHRALFRPVVMHLNAVGGVTILDALETHDIQDIVTNKLSQLKSSNQPEDDIELNEEEA